MTNHPNRTPRNAIFFEQGYALIATPHGVIETTRLQQGQYVRIDDGRQYPQLCVGASRMGPTIEYQTDEALAYACRARLYRTRPGFNAAAERITAA